MPNVRRLLAVLWTAAVFALSAGLPAQDIRYVHPEKYERATKTDDHGLLQWAEHAPPKCTTCSGTGKTKCSTCERFFDDAKVCIECKRTKEAVCRACAGLGHFADPLEKALCPGCQGAGFLLCHLCNGGGRIRGEDGERWSSCPVCRGDGGWKCGGCNGNRLVEVAQVKPSLRDAQVPALQKALATTDEALEGLAKFSPANLPARKAVKELVKQLQIAQQLYPPLKRLQKPFEDAMSKTAGGAQYQGQAEREGAVLGGVKGSAEYYLKHQRRMLELALKRAEANAKVLEENKGK